MPSSLKAILFDADGVIQRPAVDYTAALTALGALEADACGRLIQEIFSAELPGLSGKGDFTEDLRHVLSRWRLAERLADVLRIWTSIRPDPAIFELIASVRSFGIRCCLATNQQAYRGSYMSESLRYRDLFDVEFYSYQLGVAKPASEYFRAIVERLSLAPAEVLFIDDHERNVAAARSVGIHASLYNAEPESSCDVLRAILSQHGLSLP